MSANGTNGQANGSSMNGSSGSRGSGNGGSGNGGSGRGGGGAGPEDTLRELATACVRFVERSLGIRLDFEPETLPVLDHYLEQARQNAREKPETALLVAQSAGAYFGEVLRRRHPAWWKADDEDPTLWEVQLETAHLALRPISMALEALTRPPTPEPPPEAREDDEDDEDEDDDPGEREEQAERDAEKAAEEGREEQAEQGAERDEEELAGLILREENRPAVAARLAELPPVSEREYYALSTRLEVVDIAVDALHALRVEAGEPAELHLTPADYED